MSEKRAADAGAGTAVVTGDGSSRRHPYRKYAVLAAILGAIILGGLLYWLLVGRGHDAAKKPQTTGTVAKTPEQAKRQEAALDAKGDFDGQAKLLEQQLSAGNLPKDQQIQDTQTLATTYLNAKRYSKALEAYDQLGQLDPSKQIEVYRGKAFAYQQMGRNDQAVDYYKLGLAAMEQKDPSGYSFMINNDKAMVANLGGKL